MKNIEKKKKPCSNAKVHCELNKDSFKERNLGSLVSVWCTPMVNEFFSFCYNLDLKKRKPFQGDGKMHKNNKSTENNIFQSLTESSVSCNFPDMFCLCRFSFYLLSSNFLFYFQTMFPLVSASLLFLCEFLLSD